MALQKSVTFISSPRSGPIAMDEIFNAGSKIDRFLI
jgi:hypothetical protein